MLSHTCDCEDLQIQSWVNAIQEQSSSRLKQQQSSEPGETPGSFKQFESESAKEKIKTLHCVINNTISLPYSINTQTQNCLGQSDWVERINVAKKMFLTAGSWTLGCKSSRESQADCSLHSSKRRQAKRSIFRCRNVDRITCIIETYSINMGYICMHKQM